MYKDFEDFLADKFNKYDSSSTDDNWIDAFETWLDELDRYDLIRYADEYAKTIRRA